MSSKDSSLYISVVIPAYNEEKRLPHTLRMIDRYFKKQKYSYELIIVDDGSTDNTFLLIEDIIKHVPGIKLLRNPQNRGKGYSVKKGILEAEGEYILFSDSDLSTPIDELERCLNYLNGNFDIVIGSRSLRLGAKIKKRQAKYRQELGHLFSYIQKFILKTGIDDTQCGFKCFKNKVAKDIFIRQRLERFCFDVEILFIAKQLGYHIKEMPITWRNHPESKVKALVDGARMFFDLLKIRYNFMRGFYSKDNLKC